MTAPFRLVRLAVPQMSSSLPLTTNTDSLIPGVSTPHGLDPTYPPEINIHPPSASTPTQSDFLPNDTYIPPSDAYVPPSERGPSPARARAVSQPPPSERQTRKSVAFAAEPDVQPAESEASSPEQPRHRHRLERGYEAGDDTDSTPDDQRRRQRGGGNAGESSRSATLDSEAAAPDDGSRKRHHRRRRSHDPSSSGDKSSLRPDRNQTTSPAESDATVDLPARFDNKGNKRAEQGDDPLADRIDGILQGKGTAGKMFGNFVDGLFGPEGRKKRDR